MTQAAELKTLYRAVDRLGAGLADAREFDVDEGAGGHRGGTAR